MHRGVDDVAAVALILNYVTAYQALHRVARLVAGQTALVTGASGGVGTALLELLRVAGVRAIGAASPARHALIAELGATAIHGRGRRFDRQLAARGLPKADAAFDLLGGRFVRECIGATKLGGSVVGIGFGDDDRRETALRPARTRRLLAVRRSALARQARAPLRHHQAVPRRSRPFRQDLPKLFALQQAGRLHPKIHARLPLLAAREASELLERGGIEGKIVHLATVWNRQATRS